MPTAKKKTVKPAARAKASSGKAKKHFLKTPVGVAILITLLVAALVFITGQSQEDRSAVDARSEYPAEQLQTVGNESEDMDEAGDVDETDEEDDADEETEATETTVY